MNIFDLFRPAVLLNAVFQLGYIPKREEFYELTPEQYEKYYENEEMEEDNEKIFMLLPNDIEKYNELASGDVFACSEKEISEFEDVEKLIDKYCKNSGKTFKTFEDKLCYVASVVPPCFTAGTRFEKKRLIYFNDLK
ncbi:MAG: hypothetical protein LBS55_12305 [Prevotellaceae bacterium]|jgi:hypothetical protein|nr:hypothetical protein [Prevotellaceae bacterium]